MVLSGRAFLRRHKDDHGLGVRIVFYMIKLAKGTKSDLHDWLDFFLAILMFLLCFLPEITSVQMNLGCILKHQDLLDIQLHLYLAINVPLQNEMIVGNSKIW